MKVIGAGFGRTGTASLKVALETLDFSPCYHMTEVFAHPEHADFWVAAFRGEPVDWDGVLGGYEAAVDWPACTFYEELMERHPEAKVILTVRDPERWYESVRNTIYELSVVIPAHPSTASATRSSGYSFPARPDKSTWRTKISGKAPSTDASKTGTTPSGSSSNTPNRSGNVFPRIGCSSTRSRMVGDRCAGFSGLKSRTNHFLTSTTLRR